MNLIKYIYDKSISYYLYFSIKNRIKTLKNIINIFIKLKIIKI
jgi:hypothetical protein